MNPTSSTAAEEAAPPQPVASTSRAAASSTTSSTRRAQPSSTTTAVVASAASSSTRPSSSSSATLAIKSSPSSAMMPDNSNGADEDELMTTDDEDDGAFDDTDDIMNASSDDITMQLANAGPTGVAAAAAISSTKKRRRRHSFETNPSIRKRQQTRLLRKLRQNIEEYSLRVGRQAVVLVATPGKSRNCFRAFGAKPLEDVVKNLRAIILSELETALSQQAPPEPAGDPNQHELPPLVIGGIPTPVEKMTQAQLRAFVPLMLKYSTGRGKPGWGKEATRPSWWPSGVPWANVGMDARKEDEKQKVSWTHALRQIVLNCYRFHNRDDLLPTFNEEEEQMQLANGTAAPQAGAVERAKAGGVVGQQAPAADEVSSAAEAAAASFPHHFLAANPTPTSTNSANQVAQYQQPTTIVQTLADGTVSLIQVDPSNPIITLPDGTQAQIQGLDASAPYNQQGVHTLAEVAAAVQNSAQHQSQQQQQQQQQQQIIAAPSQQQQQQQLELTGTATGELTPEGHILIAGEDGQAYPISVSGMITLPVNSCMYQAVMQQVGDSASVGQQVFLGSGLTGTIVQTKAEPGQAQQSQPAQAAPPQQQVVQQNAKGGLTITPVTSTPSGQVQHATIATTANGQQVIQLISAPNTPSTTTSGPAILGNRKPVPASRLVKAKEGTNTTQVIAIKSEATTN